MHEIKSSSLIAAEEKINGLKNERIVLWILLIALSLCSSLYVYQNSFAKDPSIQEYSATNKGEAKQKQDVKEFSATNKGEAKQKQDIKELNLQREKEVKRIEYLVSSNLINTKANLDVIDEEDIDEYRKVFNEAHTYLQKELASKHLTVYSRYAHEEYCKLLVDYIDIKRSRTCFELYE